MTDMIRILFACHDNVALSPMAAQIFSHILRKKKISSHFKVDSAAISEDAKVGVAMTDGAKNILSHAGVDSGSHTSVKLDASVADKFDWIVCMTGMDRRKCFDIFKGNAVYVTPKDVRRVFKTDPASPISLDGSIKPRVCCLMDFTGFSRDLIDPEKTGDYRMAFNELSSGCSSIISLTSFGL